MATDRAKSKAQEHLVFLYLHLNGFFVTGFMAHSPVHGENLTEIDALAVRHPHNDEPEREVGRHELLGLSSHHTDLVICEVESKGGAAPLQRRLDDECLRRNGCSTVVGPLPGERAS